MIILVRSSKSRALLFWGPKIKFENKFYQYRSKVCPEIGKIIFDLAAVSIFPSVESITYRMVKLVAFLVVIILLILVYLFCPH